MQKEKALGRVYICGHVDECVRVGQVIVEGLLKFHQKLFNGVKKWEPTNNTTQGVNMICLGNYKEECASDCLCSLKKGKTEEREIRMTSSTGGQFIIYPPMFFP